MTTFNLDTFIHLAGKHPELAGDAAFNDWLRRYGGRIWHDTHVSAEGISNVIVQSLDRRRLFAVQLQQDLSRVTEGVISETILRREDFDLAADQQHMSPLASLQAVHPTFKGKRYDVQAVRPVVAFSRATPTLRWEVDVVSGAQLQTYSVIPPDSVQRVSAHALEPSRGLAKSLDRRALVPPFADDSLEENELHHLSQYAAMAREWTQGAVTPGDKAFRIWLNVRQKMAYDLNITNIAEFTWADSLVIGQLQWRGICDEYAVIQITMLRALGIPAVMKFLIWKQPNGSGAGHACLEWLDGSQWRHMDALWNAWDDRAVYRRNAGAKDVTVMDASFPRDSRSTAPAWGVPDPTGDLKVHPYADYIINPAYPGNARPGYSF